MKVELNESEMTITIMALNYFIDYAQSGDAQRGEDNFAQAAMNLKRSFQKSLEEADKAKKTKDK